MIQFEIQERIIIQRIHRRDAEFTQRMFKSSPRFLGVSLSLFTSLGGEYALKLTHHFLLNSLR